MITKIEDNRCWICGSYKDLTLHHALPQHLKARNNVLIPICKKCHDLLNDDDKASIKPMMRKIFFSLESIKDLFDSIDNKVQLGEIIDNKK